MNNRIYVANISFQASEQDLKSHFSGFGEVQDVKILSDRDTGRSRGFGFITMQTEAEASSAISGLNDSDFMGRRLFVSVAREREQRSGGSNFRGGGDRPRNNYSNNDGYSRVSSGGGFNGRSSGRGSPDVEYRGRQDTFSNLDTAYGIPVPTAGRRFDRAPRRSRQTRHDDGGEF
jgi:cold-inducible RNA-binding protein